MNILEDEKATNVSNAEIMVTEGLDRILQKDWISARAIIGDLRDIDPAAAKTLQESYDEHMEIYQSEKRLEAKEDDSIEQGREDALNG